MGKFNEWAKEWLGVSDEQLNCDHYPEGEFVAAEFKNECDRCGLNIMTDRDLGSAKAAWDARGKYDPRTK